MKKRVAISFREQYHGLLVRIQDREDLRSQSALDCYSDQIEI